MPFNIPRNQEELIAQVHNLLNISPLKPPQEQSLQVAVYTRKSRLLPGKAEYSMDFQPGDAEEHIRSQPRWQLFQTYADPNKTGRNGRRNGLQALKRDIQAGSVDIVWSTALTACIAI